MTTSIFKKQLRASSGNSGDMIRVVILIRDRVPGIPPLLGARSLRAENSAGFLLLFLDKTATAQGPAGAFVLFQVFKLVIGRQPQKIGPVGNHILERGRPGKEIRRAFEMSGGAAPPIFSGVGNQPATTGFIST